MQHVPDVGGTGTQDRRCSAHALLNISYLCALKDETLGADRDQIVGAGTGQLIDADIDRRGVVGQFPPEA